jgi:uncharacterized membrane protein
MDTEKKNTAGVILTQLLTGIDNKTHDVIRWLAIITFVTALSLTIYIVVIKDNPFNIQDFCIALSSLFVAVGGALKLKETTEPGLKTNNEGNEK